MALELSTAGISLSYAIETTSGTRPTTGLINIPNVKTIGDLNPEPATYEVTDLSDLVWKRYIDGLKDPGGAIPFTVNLTAAFRAAWDTLVAAAATGRENDLSCWFCVKVPNFADFWFAGIPNELGLPEVDTDGVFEGDVYITPNQILGWVDAA